MSDSAYPALGFDPAPGNLHEVAALVGTLQKVGSEVAGVRQDLRSIGSVGGAWIGQAATAFVDALGELPSYLDRAEQSTYAAYRALTSWQYDLEDFERRGRMYEQRAEEARQRVAEARGMLDALPAVTGQMTERAADELTGQIQAAQRAYDAAAEELNQILQAARRMFEEHQDIAREIAERVRDAADHAPPEPGLFETLVHAVAAIDEIVIAVHQAAIEWIAAHGELWKRIGDLLADAAMVVGIAVAAIMLFTNPAGWLVLTAVGLSAGALAFHSLAKASGAKVSTQTLVMDSFGLLAGVGALAAGTRMAAAGGRLAYAGARTARTGRAAIASSSRVSSTLRGAGQVVRGRATQLGGYAVKYNSNIVDYTGYGTYGYQHVQGGVSYKDIPVIGTGSKLISYFTDDSTEAASGRGSAGSAGRAFTTNIAPARGSRLVTTG